MNLHAGIRRNSSGPVILQTETEGPQLFLEKLIPLATYRLNERTPVREGTELAAYAAEVHVNASIVARMHASQGALRKVGFTDRTTHTTQQNLEESELRAREGQRLA